MHLDSTFRGLSDFLDTCPNKALREGFTPWCELAVWALLGSKDLGSKCIRTSMYNVGKP